MSNCEDKKLTYADIFDIELREVIEECDNDKEQVKLFYLGSIARSLSEITDVLASMKEDKNE